MTDFSFYNRENEKKKKKEPRNLELWNLDADFNDTNKEIEFHAPGSNLIIRVKDIDKDLIPDDFEQAL